MYASTERKTPDNLKNAAQRKQCMKTSVAGPVHFDTNQDPRIRLSE